MGELDTKQHEYEPKQEDLTQRLRNLLDEGRPGQDKTPDRQPFHQYTPVESQKFMEGHGPRMNIFKDMVKAEKDGDFKFAVQLAKAYINLFDAKESAHTRDDKYRFGQARELIISYAGMDNWEKFDKLRKANPQPETATGVELEGAVPVYELERLVTAPIGEKIKVAEQYGTTPGVVQKLLDEYMLQKGLRTEKVDLQ